MKRSGFTMIELIFVIVILGILAAVAIPKLAATRDDAKIAAVKTDVGTMISSVPAWYTGQKEASVQNAMSLDTSNWKQTSGKEEYKWTDGTQECVIVRIVDQNSTVTSTTPINVGTTTFTYEPTLVIAKGSGAPGTAAICKALWDGKQITEQNVSMAGRKVVL